MKTESTVRPSLVERYPGLVRINYDVQEEQRAASMYGGSDDAVTFYAYRMVELTEPYRFRGLSELTDLLMSDKYPVAEQLAILYDGTEAEKWAMKEYRFHCKQVAMQVLGIPETPGYLSELRQMAIERINAHTDQLILTGYQWTVLHGQQAGTVAGVWLNKENQFNYFVTFIAAVFDVLLQTSTVEFPQMFKIGEDSDGRPIYEEFQTLTELSTFCLGGLAHISRCTHDGWGEKDSIDDSNTDGHEETA